MSWCFDVQAMDTKKPSLELITKTTASYFDMPLMAMFESKKIREIRTVIALMVYYGYKDDEIRSYLGTHQKKIQVAKGWVNNSSYNFITLKNRINTLWHREYKRF